MFRYVEWGSAIAAMIVLAACASGGAGAAKATLDAAAEAYVKLVLAVGRHDPLYVDAFYGPEDWKSESEAGAPLALDELARRARDLLAQVRAAEGPADRKRYIEKQLVAVEAQIRRLSGERFTLEQECELLYDARPQRHAVEEFKAAHGALEKLVPGEGPLPDRIEAMRRAIRVPREHVEATVRAALATSRAAGAPQAGLPESESFEFALVTGKPWGAYNWYLGNYRSRIELNVDLPTELNSLLGTMCHEGYPGHHTYNALLEDRLMKGKGWVEYAVYPLYSPQSLLAEGTANAAEDLLFSEDERRRVLANVLAPVAHVDPKAVLAWEAVREAMHPLRHVRPEAARMLLDEGMSEDDAVAFIRTWSLVDEAKARKAIDFARTYRSYVYNYTLGDIWSGPTSGPVPIASSASTTSFRARSCPPSWTRGQSSI